MSKMLLHINSRWVIFLLCMTHSVLCHQSSCRERDCCMRLLASSCHWISRCSRKLLRNGPHGYPHYSNWVHYSLIGVLYQTGSIMAPLNFHHVCDTSSVSYGARSYVRVINLEEKIHVPLVTTKLVNIRRLEFCAAVEGVKLNQMILRVFEVPLMKSFYWTGSHIFLSYIQNESRRLTSFCC